MKTYFYANTGGLHDLQISKEDFQHYSNRPYYMHGNSDVPTRIDLWELRENLLETQPATTSFIKNLSDFLERRASCFHHNTE